MNDSILNTIKKMLGMPAEYTAFDTDIVMFINSALATLSQNGVGTPGGFMIQDATATWEDFIGNDPNLNHVVTYIYISTKLLFDPPTNGFLVTSLKENQLELLWRLEVTANPAVPVPVADDAVLDGGAP